MNLTKNGVTIIVDDAEIVRMALERLNSADGSDLLRFGSAVTPRIGEFWCGQGGVYAGIARGRDGAADYHVIVGPEYDGTETWDALTAWAKGLSLDGRSDFTLPTRKEQALLFANVSELFKPEWYWSSEQHESGHSYAWSQDFDDGNQNYWFKGLKLRARAVRRLVIQ